MYNCDCCSYEDVSFQHQSRLRAGSPAWTSKAPILLFTQELDTLGSRVRRSVADTVRDCSCSQVAGHDIDAAISTSDTRLDHHTRLVTHMDLKTSAQLGHSHRMSVPVLV